MTASRSFLVAALAAALVLPAAAQAQLMPEGHPPNEHPWALAHTFVWHDAGGWHLRVTTEGQFHQFTGWVDSPQGLGGANPVVPGTPLNVNWRQIQYNIGVQGGENGFDWQQSAPCATFSLVQDGQQQPFQVDVGAYSGHPPSYAPFELCSVMPGYAAPPPVAAAPPPVEEQPVDVESPLGPEMDPAAFQSVLAPYGSWMNIPPYGLAWQPYAGVVGPDFVPYGTAGNWVYSDAGWVWNSEYPWGWATFHYGNWVTTPTGWAWVPGSVWAPAWVSWRYGDGIVGWAPMGPGGVVENVPYVFCEPRYMIEPHFARYLIRGPRAIEYERRAPVITSIRYVGGRPVVPVRAGPPPREIERFVGRPIRPVAMTVVARRSMPPPTVRGVRYAPGASAAHPFVRQTVRVAPAVQPGMNRPFEQRPMEGRPMEQRPFEQRPMEQRPMEQRPMEARPMEQRPMEQRPMEQRPMEQRPMEQRPMEQRPFEQRPMERPAVEQRPMERPAAAPRPPPPPPPKRQEAPPRKNDNKRK